MSVYDKLEQLGITQIPFGACVEIELIAEV